MGTALHTETRSLVEQAAWSRRCCVCDTAVSSAQLLKEAGGGKVGFLAVQMMRGLRGATAKRVHNMIVGIVKRVIAVSAAGTAVLRDGSNMGCNITVEAHMRVQRAAGHAVLR